MQITTAIVDDNEMDRYIARRYISRRDEFAECIELGTGTEFLEAVQNGQILQPTSPHPMLVLMDINMPGLNGFETAQALHELVDDNAMRESIVVMMFSSSDNDADRVRAAQIPIVKGYIVKPLSDADVDRLLGVYASWASKT